MLRAAVDLLRLLKRFEAGILLRLQAQERIEKLLEQGLQIKPDVKKRLPVYTGSLTESVK